MTGTVYTETVVHAAPRKFVSDAPYQIAIVTLADGRRTTGRILGERVAIEDPVELVEERDGVPYFRKI
ncbi:MAG: OB-fold domain-containing protein [Acidobacteria bacterium]|nr:OB-fold domain-containing protein [Acidobacteriota bacterium]MBI3279133.1 OB-fold domain-containing protein [Acidobacteriota bacterium]